MQGLTEETNILLNKIMVMLNAYHVATMTDEQKDKYNQLIIESGLFDISIED